MNKALPMKPEDALNDLLRKEGSQKAVAKKLHISSGYLCDVINRRKGISASLGKKLGFRHKDNIWERINA